MPRRGGGGGFGGNRSSRSRSTSQSPPRPAPKYTPAPAQQAPQRGGMMSGLGGMVMTGMALGAGSEIAHQGVRGLMGAGSGGQQAPAEYDQQNVQPYQQQQQNYCSNESNSFIECLKKNSDISFCQMYSDALKECQKKYGN